MFIPGISILAPVHVLSNYLIISSKILELATLLKNVELMKEDMKLNQGDRIG
jgi:hypothetical protein